MKSTFLRLDDVTIMAAAAMSACWPEDVGSSWIDITVMSHWCHDYSNQRQLDRLFNNLFVFYNKKNTKALTLRGDTSRIWMWLKESQSIFAKQKKSQPEKLLNGASTPLGGPLQHMDIAV